MRRPRLSDEQELRGTMCAAGSLWRRVWPVALYPLTTMTRHVRAATLSGAVLVAAIACERSAVRELDAAPPLGHVSMRSWTPPVALLSWSQDIMITLARDVDVSKLVDLRVFAGLQPGTTIEQAASKLGAPARAWSDDLGTWSEYRNQWGTLQVGCERSRSVPTSDTSCNWRLYAHPIGAISMVFGRAVVEQIEVGKRMTPRASHRTIMLWSWDHNALVDASLVGERITRMMLHAYIVNQ